MDFTKIQYFEKVEKPSQQEFINAHSNCVLCGTVLEIQLIRLDQEQSIKEEAFCPTCDVKTRAKTHSLN
jgi:hypothetical protein